LTLKETVPPEIVPDHPGTRRSLWTAGQLNDKPDYRAWPGGDIWNRSLTASLNFCLHPMYRSVVWTEA